MLVVLIIVLVFNLFLFIDIFKPLSLNVGLDKALVTKIYTGNKAVELTAKLNLNGNKDLPIEFIEFKSTQNGVILYEDGSTDEAFIRIRNTKSFLNGKDKVNLRLLVSNFDSQKQVRALRFNLISKAVSYNDETSNDDNELYLPISSFNELKQDLFQGTIDLVKLNSINKLELLTKLPRIETWTLEGMTSIFEDNIIVYINGEKLYTLNLRTGELNQEKELGVFFSGENLNTQSNQPYKNNLIAVEDSVFFTSDLGFIVRYDFTTNTAYKFSDSIVKQTNNKHIDNYENNLIASFDNILVVNSLEDEFENSRLNELKIQFDYIIDDLMVEGDQLFLVINNNIVIIELNELLKKLDKVANNQLSDLIPAGVLNLNTININQEADHIIGINDEFNSLIFGKSGSVYELFDYNLADSNLIKGRDYKYKTKNNIYFDYNTVEYNRLDQNNNLIEFSEEISLYPIQVLTTNKGNFIVDADNSLYFLK